MNSTRAASRPTRVPLPRVTFLRFSLVAGLVLILSAWVFVLSNDRDQGGGFFSVETLQRGWRFLQDLFGVNSSASPAFAQWGEWRRIGGLAYDTLVMSILGIGLAGVVALATFMFGARNVMMGELAPYASWPWKGLFFIVRALFILSRSVPELVWAMLIVFIFSPGILPGAVALALHNTGVLGKLSAEVVEGLDPRPIRSLRSTGAGNLQVLAYAVLPQALPRFVTYLFYRWEVIIRTTIVVGFVAAGGLGTEFRLSMSHFHYTTVTLILIWYLILVVAVDLIAAFLRRLAR
jgi:phosphonate transport system permease protein